MRMSSGGSDKRKPEANPAPKAILTKSNGVKTTEESASSRPASIASSELPVNPKPMPMLRTNGWKEIQKPIPTATGKPTEKPNNSQWRAKKDGKSSPGNNPQARKQPPSVEGEAQEKKVSYLVAATASKSGKQDSIAAVKPSIERGKLQVPVAVSQTMAGPKKKKPTKTLDVDLLTLALRAQKADEDRKRQAHTVVSRPNPTESGVGEKKIGKVRGPGELARRKNRLSSLKKRIIQERLARWWLLHPETKPFPLTSHPGLIGYECVWLSPLEEQETFESEEEDERDSGEEEEEEHTSRDEEEEKVPTGNGTRLGDEDEKTEDNSDGEDGDEGEEDSMNGEDEESTEDRTREEKVPSVKSDEATSGSCPFDVNLCSPVFFGAFYRRVPLIDQQQQPPPFDTKNKMQKTPVLPLKFPVRDYVDQAISKELDDLCLEMLSTLFKFQERGRLEDPMGSKMRRRLVMGLHEVRRGVRSRRCIAVVIAFNVEDAQGLDEKIQEVLSLCTSTEDGQDPIPIIFASNKRQLGRSLGKNKASISCIGIYSADGAHESFKKSLKLAAKLKQFWHNQVTDERRQAALGKRTTCMTCGSTSLSEDHVRRDCLVCRNSFCEPCAARNKAKEVPCVSSSPNEPAICQIVRVARIPPKVQAKSLSVSAKEFRPPTHFLTPPPLFTFDSMTSQVKDVTWPSPLM